MDIPKMRVITPGEIPVRDMHQYLIASVAPRPIAFVSTVNQEGEANLAPYSFFNAFSSNPPILVFSSNRRVMDNTTKDTLHNVRETRECVINTVSYHIVRQMAVTSIQYPSTVDEFRKSGLTPLAADLVKPYRVLESPVQMECRVQDIITLGAHGGAGHLIINEVLRMHIREDIIDGNNRIDPYKIDLMGRLGRAYYVRVNGDAIHTIVQPVTQIGIGYDALPESVRKSRHLTANDIGILAGLKNLPDDHMINEVLDSAEVKMLLEGEDTRAALHRMAKKYLELEQHMHAASLLLIADHVEDSDS